MTGRVPSKNLSIADHKDIPAGLPFIIPDCHRITAAGRQFYVLFLACPVRCAAEGLEE